jgi:hypothetical protein
LGICPAWQARGETAEAGRRPNLRQREDLGTTQLVEPSPPDIPQQT